MTPQQGRIRHLLVWSVLVAHACTSTGALVVTPDEYGGCKQIWFGANAASTIPDESIQYMVDQRCSQGGPGCIDGYCRRCTLIAEMHTDLVLCTAVLEATVHGKVTVGTEADDIDFDTQIEEDYADFDENQDDSALSETPAEAVAAEAAKVSGSDGGVGDGEGCDDSSSGSDEDDREEGELSSFQQLSETDFDEAIAPISIAADLMLKTGEVSAAIGSPFTKTPGNSSSDASTRTTTASVATFAASATNTTTSATPASIAVAPTAAVSLVTPMTTTKNSTTKAVTPRNSTSAVVTPTTPAGLVTGASDNATTSTSATKADVGHATLSALNTTATSSAFNATTSTSSASAAHSQSPFNSSPTPSSATPSVATSASCQTTQGDRAVGISTVEDARCVNGGVGCVSGHCRQCRLIDTPKSTHLDACLL